MGTPSPESMSHPAPSPTKHVRNKKVEAANNIEIGALSFLFSIGFVLALTGGWCLKANYCDKRVADKHSFHEIEQTEQLEMSKLDGAQKNIDETVHI
tara:strand:+ start:1656 stop:1946 length:291 start_codon:yes stop_codon:yes gene_type:complete